MSVHAQDIIDIPESSDIRSGLIESWFELPLPALRMKDEEVMKGLDGSSFQVRFEDYGDDCAIVVAPEKDEKVEVYSDSGVEILQRKIYPTEAPGSWILFKNPESGEPECIRFYFNANTEVFIQFRKSPGIPTEKSLADVFVFGEYAARDVPVGIPLVHFYDMSAVDVLSLLKYVIPWVTKPFYSSLYNDILQMTAIIRENLSRFHFLEDAAYDEMGNLVSIKNGNAIYIPTASEDSLYVSSAGFVKWIVDGLVRPLSGSGILLEPIVKKTEIFKSGSLSETMSKKYDTTLALDWTRNLAAAMVSIYSGRDYDYGTSGVQLNSVPFNGAYLEGSGFKISMLKSVFYYLAATEPGRFYLGAIRHIVNDGAEFVVYNKCAAFFPVFDKNGKFSVAVFIDGKEIKMDDFMKDYSGDFIQLVRIQASEQFFPR
ncbi:MAG: hypothetical protein K5930_10915 [Treponemataceae bacterium]|nr:hypothetical protein [Treponemataceae bacterium]